MTVLITGFGPFDGGSNASEILVRALGERRAMLADCARAPVETLILPVDTERAGDLLAEAVMATKPDRLLMCGQAARRSRICLEKLATNSRDFYTPDANGTTLSGMNILDDGPESYLATWPDLEGTVAALNAEGIPAALSEDCGTHLCNQLLYLALHAARDAGQSYAATFLHIPLLPEQVIANEPAAARNPDSRPMPLVMTQRAVEIVLARSAAALEAAA